MGPSARSKPTILKRLRTRFGIPVALVALLALAIPAGASADALGANAEFFAPEAPSYPMTLAKGPDGDVWFTEPLANKVGHIDPSEPATSLVEIALPNMSPEGSFKSLIAAGPDGNLWVTQGSNGLARITPAGVVTEFKAGLNPEANVCSVTAGPDGNVWFGDCGTTKAVGKITPGGVVTEYTVVGDAGANQPVSIALGSDNRLWFPANNATNERLGAITTAGVVTYYETPITPELTSLSSLTAGPDENIWATESFGRNEEQKVTITGEGTYKLGFEGQKTGWTGTGNITNEGTATQKKTITSPVISTGKVAKGELITGAGIPAESVVSSCVPSNCESPLTSIVMSKEATAKATGVSLSGDLTAKPASTAANVREALGKLSTIGGNANVTVLASESNRSVSFTGKFARADVPLMGCDDTNLTGAKAAALAAGSGDTVWYTSAGLPSAIGKFGTEANPELTVTKEGSGSGTVVSSPAGIGCGGTCSAEFTKNSEVTLTASPDSASLFTSWKGCEAGGY